MERRGSGVRGSRQKLGEREGYCAKWRGRDVRGEKERQTDGESWGAED